MRTFINTKLVLLLWIAITLFACTSEHQLPVIPTGSTVLILGDSLSYGTGATKGEDYPTLLAHNTGWQIVNAGVPGDTTEQGLARLPDLLAEHQPSLLMIELGGNDFLKKVPIAQTEKNLKAIIEEAKQHQIMTLLIAIPDYQPVKAAFGGLTDHTLYAKLSEETQTPLIEDVFSPVLSKNALKADYVHPNAAGYRQMEAQLRESLIKFGLLKD
ncbi:MAG: arylesterase [Methylophilaceae bacterium]